MDFVVPAEEIEFVVELIVASGVGEETSGGRVSASLEVEGEAEEEAMVDVAVSGDWITLLSSTTLVCFGGRVAEEEEEEDGVESDGELEGFWVWKGKYQAEPNSIVEKSCNSKMAGPQLTE